jgi:hypothetical protein
MKKTIIGMITAGIVLLCFCSMPMRNYLEEPPKTPPPAVDSSAAKKSDTLSLAIKKNDALQWFPAPRTIAIENWVGERFFLLEKPAMYCKYGYELYSCPMLESCRGPVDTAVETIYHRVRCGRSVNTPLSVVSIGQRGVEWLVGFRDDATGKTIYAKTSDGELHEFAYDVDYNGAKTRWTGKTIYSARGFISNSGAGKTGTIKVRLQDPLRVCDVRPGLTPLPAKPLWLMVETADGTKGVIPVRFSWTNSPASQRYEGNPWTDDIFESNPALTCAADAATWETINLHHVRKGMTREQVRLSWGRPREQTSGMHEAAERECWVYENQKLWFDAVELVGIEEK